MEGITATGTSTSTVSKPVQLSLSSFGTKSLLFFPAKSQHGSPGCRLGTDQAFISLEVHGTILIPVPDRLQSPKLSAKSSMLAKMVLVSRSWQLPGKTLRNMLFRGRISLSRVDTGGIFLEGLITQSEWYAVTAAYLSG